MKTYSLDLRQRVLAAYDSGGVTRKQVAERFDVSVGFVKKLLSQRKQTGSIVSLDFNAGRKPVFEGPDLDKLKQWVEAQPDRTLVELRDLSNKSCSIMAVHRALQRLGVRLKKSHSSRMSKNAPTSGKRALSGGKKSNRSTRGV